MPKNHPFHILPPSALPFIISFFVIIIVEGLVTYLHLADSTLITLGFDLTLFSLWLYVEAVIKESSPLISIHTFRVQRGLRFGLILFIVSEVFFFVSLFWAYLHCSLSPSVELGSLWPPAGVTPLNALHIPLLNTVLLLSSGATITWSHHSLISSSYFHSFVALGFTVLLGCVFSYLQLVEYLSSSFTIADSCYGSTFYLATGTHGLHVLGGTWFLFMNLWRLGFSQFTATRHLGFEFGCWYWHFVDVVWLLLFALVYVWGS